MRFTEKAMEMIIPYDALGNKAQLPPFNSLG